MLLLIRRCRATSKWNYSGSRCLSYVQGQSPKHGIREYFYYIDHQGQLFLDDSKMKNFTSCFKEKKFLAFFFKRLRLNETRRYQDEFPYVSPCGHEQNYVRCDDRPIVYTELIEKINRDEVKYLFSYANAKELLTVDFEPENICMLPDSGRVYHPADEHLGGIGLVKSSLAIEFSKFFDFESGENRTKFGLPLPTHFTWNGKRHTLTQKLVKKFDSQ